jgi:hypothetical protein
MNYRLTCLTLRLGLGWAVISLMSVLLLGCEERNPLLTLSSDALATRINQFDRHSLRYYDGANNCGLPLAEEGGKPLWDPTQWCEKTYFPALLHHLQTTYPSLRALTMAQLTQPATWQHYRASRLAKGKGMKME